MVPHLIIITITVDFNVIVTMLRQENCYFTIEFINYRDILMASCPIRFVEKIIMKLFSNLNTNIIILMDLLDLTTSTILNVFFLLKFYCVNFIIKYEKPLN